MSSSNTNSAKYWAVVPAAGVGRRMNSHIPKQYLSILGRTVIEHTVEKLLSCRDIQSVVIALGESDEYFQDTGLSIHERILLTVGGAERCHSVHNALVALQERADVNDWVLVHDAARPCVSMSDIEALIAYSKLPDAVGAVLGIPVRDTMKQCDSKAKIHSTVDRTHLWHAHTPQIFRLGQLSEALEQAQEKGMQVTDDASAMELAGYTPKMIIGQSSNIKITQPADLRLAEFFLKQNNK